jgi:hypothetical protein
MLQPLQVLTAIHIACDIPRFDSRKALAAFVASTLERCSARTKPLLDGELAAARERLRMADRERIGRLARRDDAIAAEMAEMLRTRATGGGGMFQPLLFEDIAIEKTTIAGAVGAYCYPPAPVSPGADAAVEAANADVETAANAADGAESMKRVESTLVMALVLR